MILNIKIITVMIEIITSSINQSNNLYLNRVTLTNLLLTNKHKSRTGEYWPKVMAVWIFPSMGQALKQARLVNGLHGTKQNIQFMAYDHFHGNSPYSKMLTKIEPFRTLGIITSRLVM